MRWPAALLFGGSGLVAPALARSVAGSSSHGNPNIQNIFAAINRVVTKLEKSAAHDAITCSEDLDRSSLSEKAINDNQRFIKETSADLDTAKAEVESLKNAVDGLKGESKGIVQDVGSLARQLRDLRAAHRAAEKRAKNSLQQLDAAITQSAWQEEQQLHNKRAKPKKLTADVSLLTRLGRELASSVSSEEASSSGPSFLQLRAAGAGAGDAAGGTAAVLKADRRALQEARNAEAGDFRKKDKELMDLIRSKRAQLKKVEGNCNEQQPVLAEKSKEAAELEDSIRFAKRDMKQLQALRGQAQQTCSLRESGNARLDQLRAQTLTSMKMAAKLVGGLDAVQFLSKDLSALGEAAAVAAPALVQLRAASSRARDAQEGLGQEVQQALQQAEGIDIPAEPVERRAEADESQDSALLEEGSSAASGAEAEGEAAGPFDSVKGMISDLISDLRSQGNQDVDQNQFCMNAQAENDRNRVEAKVALDEASTQILWAKAAMERLDAQQGQLREDAAELQKIQGNAQTAAQHEKVSAAAQLADLDGERPRLYAAFSTLQGVCKGAFFVQGASDAAAEHAASAQDQSKFNTCREAVKQLQDALNKGNALRNAIWGYQRDFNARDGEHARAVAAAVSNTQSDLESLGGNRARRANELAVAKGDEKQKKADLGLVAKAAQELESQCSVKESADQSMARRQEQIDELKSAVKVLNGEEVPV